MKKIAAVACLGVLANAAVSADYDGELVKPENVVTDKSIDEPQRNAQSLAARRYYTFWDTGNAKFAKAALAENFKDLNLPQGRVQGPEGPLQASAQFRQAVPDLKVAVTEMLIVDDRVIGRLHFTGHFTGKFGNLQGKGQVVDFSAVDIYRIANGKIIENWHLEDNLTLLQQFGAVKMDK
ncbi:MAG: ester cyclase [Gammaproteobacteria bacterium]|nr:MAG: ester cyclase [Gammaproteobacteria bacterium]